MSVPPDSTAAAARPPAPGVAEATAGELATLLEAELLGPADAVLTHLDAIDRAGPGALTFVRSGKYARGWPASAAAAAIVGREVPLAAMRPGEHDGRPLLIVGDADLALIRALERFAPPSTRAAPGIHPTAVVDRSARVAASAHVGPHCVVMGNAWIGEDATLVAGVFVGEGASVGDGSVLHAGVRVLDRCVLGRRCELHPGVVIGADGFGYRPGPDGRSVVKIPHIGDVIVGDHVDIGANSCVDRAKFGSTTVGHGTKIDNMVQIAHGCRVGQCCLICAFSALAGSVTLGDGVVLGGKVAVADNVEIGAGTRLAACSAVANNVPPGVVWMGAPAGPAGEWRRIYAALRRMGKRSGRTPIEE